MITLAFFDLLSITSLHLLLQQLFWNYNLQRKLKTRVWSRGLELKMKLKREKIQQRCWFSFSAATVWIFIWFPYNGNLWPGVAGHVKPHYSFPILPSHTHTPTPTSPNSWDFNRNHYNFFLANSWVSISLVLILGANLGFDVPTSLRVDVCLVWCGFNISCWHRSRNPPSSLPQQIVSIQPLPWKAWIRIWLFFGRQNDQWCASQFCRGDEQRSVYWIIILGFIWCAFINSRRSGVVAICLFVC